MATLTLKSLAVTAQVHFPTLADGKAALLAWYRRSFQRPRDAALRALHHFDLGDLGEVLDIGSAYGESTAALRALAPRARIIAFEPNAFYVSKVLSRFRHDPAISARRCALTDVNGPLPLFIPAYNYTLFPDLATFDRGEATNWLASRIIGYDSHRLSVMEVTAESRTLDGLELTPSLLRIDARCDASAIILGGAGTLSRHRPIIAVESAVLRPTSLDSLQAAGYQAFRWLDDQLVRSPWPGPADLLLQESHLQLWRGRSASHRGTDTRTV